MVVIHPLSNFLSNLKNHTKANRTKMYHPHSKFVFNFTQLLLEQGYIRSFNVDDDKVNIIIYLREKSETHYINDIKIISRPGYRNYVKSSDLGMFRKDGLTIFSSSNHGLMTLPKALKLNCGGEYICFIK